MQFLTLAALGASLASAHFQINYPYWRANSFNAPYLQYNYPCAGVDSIASGSGNNRTLWPLDGGSLNIDFHHPFTYVFINLGLGNNVSTFNISLTTLPLNETGNGTLCIDKWTIPAGALAGVADGTNASIQISTVGPTGAALYNCADITLTKNASLLPASQCSNSTGVGWTYLSQEFNGSTKTPTSSAGSASNSSAATKSWAPRANGIDVMSVTAFIGLVGLWMAL